MYQKQNLCIYLTLRHNYVIIPNTAGKVRWLFHNQSFKPSCPTQNHYRRGVAQLGRALGSGPRSRVFKSPHSDQQKTHFCLLTKVRFLNDVCLRQMILASPNDVRYANDACLMADRGKNRIIAERLSQSLPRAANSVNLSSNTY